MWRSGRPLKLATKKVQSENILFKLESLMALKLSQQHYITVENVRGINLQQEKNKNMFITELAPPCTIAKSPPLRALVFIYNNFIWDFHLSYFFFLDRIYNIDLICIWQVIMKQELCFLWPISSLYVWCIPLGDCQYFVTTVEHRAKFP